MFKKRGQSILEYVIVLTAIVAAIAIAAFSVITPAVKQMMNETNTTIRNATARLNVTR